MNNDIRHLTEKEQLEKYIENLKVYQQQVLQETQQEIEKAKVKIKTLKNAELCRDCAKKALRR